MVRFLNFESVLEDIAKKDLQELEKKLDESISDDKFIYEVCLPLINGGKRLRPVLFLLCSRSLGELDLKKNLPLATALELIHTASLVHDDVLDNAKKRRRVPTINSKYGAQISVLIGDYLFAKAFELVAQGNYNSGIDTVLSKLVMNLCVGEIMQDRALYTVPTMSEYYERINLKTAVFLSTCCRLGGMVAEMDEKDVEALANYGSSLGLAFQIIDDLLDFFGDEKVTGKKIGGDIKSGVVNLPVIRALKVSDEADVLKEIVTRKEVTDADVEDALEIIRSTDAIDYCKMRADGHIDTARLSLPFLMKTSVELALEQIADFVVDRTW